MGQDTGPSVTSQSQRAHPTTGTLPGLRTHLSGLEEVLPSPRPRAHLHLAPRWLVIGTSILLPHVFLNAHDGTFPTVGDTQAPSYIPLQMFHHFSFWDLPLLSWEASLYSGPGVGGCGDVSRLVLGVKGGTGCEGPSTAPDTEAPTNFHSLPHSSDSLSFFATKLLIALDFKCHIL